MTQLPLEITCHQLHVLRQQGAPLVLVDCREAEEHALVAIEGNRLIPMSQFPERVEELAPNRQSHIVVYCHVGFRSAQVAAWLREQQFPQAQSLAGGIDAWATQIDTTLPRY